MSEDLDARSPSRTPLLRRLSWLVVVGFAAVAVGLYVGASRLADDQESRLLEERTSEVGTLLSSSVSTSLTSALTSLATVAQQGDPAAFVDAAKKLTATGNPSAVALLKQDGTSWVVQASAGSAPSAGQVLSGPRLAQVTRASGQISSGIIALSPGQSRLAVALGAPATPTGTVVYEEFVVDPSRPARVTQAQPFHELNVAVYVGTRATPSQLLLSTTPDLPIKGRTASSQVAIGNGAWLAVASARQPLSGALANDVPKILAAAVLLIGLAMAALVESVARRRDYAVSLVAERTGELEESLSKLEDAQQALVTNERLAALGQMAATVGHELRNPLGVLTNSLYLIRNAMGGNVDDRLRRQLDTADREIAAATLIVSDLLEFSRPRTANPTPVDMGELLAEAVSVAPPPSGIDIVVEHEGVPPVVADRDQIRQVILNLLTNAYEAMPEGGEIRLVAKVVGRAVELRVTDSGVGMDEQTRAQVFEPFFSLKIKGTGLGLAVSKRIVEAHDGTLSMVSQEGMGCTAVMSLPLTAATVGAST